MGSIMIFFATILVLFFEQISMIKIMKYAETQSHLIDDSRSAIYCYRPYDGPLSQKEMLCLPQRLDHQASGSRWPLAMCQVAKAALDLMKTSSYLEKESGRCR